MELNLSNKAALVIASSKGLGRAVAEQLVKEGASVMITSRNEDNLKKVQEELLQYETGNVSFFKADITNPNEVKMLIIETINQLGRIDILVNNAGGPPAGTFEEIAEEDWQKAFELNLLSFVRITKYALPYLKVNGGKIINIASSSVKEPIPGLILSNTLRLGIVGLTKTLAQEFAAYNILINTVAPGRIATDRVAELDEIVAKKHGLPRGEIEAKMKAIIPLGRYGTPQEFANFVTFLVSDANTYMTGNTYLVDGGMVKSI